MHKIFAGKYSFQSTNSTGSKKYLSCETTQGQSYPVMNAAKIGETEKWIIYSDNSELFLQSGNLLYTGGIASVGWVASYPNIGKALPMRITRPPSRKAKFQILVDNIWQNVRYSITEPLPYLVFPITQKVKTTGRSAADLIADNKTFTDFSWALITPGLKTIQSTKNAKGLNLRNVDLTGADLSGVDCTKADFTGAILKNTNFNGAILNGATFLKSQMDGTIFTGAKLNGAIFTGTILSKTIWGGGIEAKAAHFENCVGIDVKMGSATSANKADFTGAHFEGADFSYADFSYAVLDQCHMLRGVFVGAIFQETSFISAQLGGVDKSAATNMSFSYMTNANFKKANLFGVSFTFSTIIGALTNLSQTATLEQADFSNAYLEGVTLADAKLSGTKFSNACLVNVDFTNANLSPTSDGSITTSLAGAMLQGAKFPLANLQNADLTNATIAFANGHAVVRYCNPLTNSVFPPPPGEQLAHHATQSLDLTTLTSETICPNGLTVKANQSVGNDLQTMLTTKSPKNIWTPVQCSFANNALGKIDEQYFLKSERVGMSVFSFKNRRAIRRLTVDPDICQRIFRKEKLTLRQTLSFIQFFEAQHRLSQLSYWVAYRLSDHAVMGMSGLTLSHIPGAIEMNTGVLPEFRSDPLVRDMVDLVINHAFDTLGLDEIHGFVEVDNIAGQKFTLKLGFQDITIDDGLENLGLLHYILKADWAY